METILQTVRRFATKDIPLTPERSLGELGVASSLGLSLLRVALERRHGAGKTPLLSAGLTLGALASALGEAPATGSAEGRLPVAAAPANSDAAKGAGTAPSSGQGGGLWGRRRGEVSHRPVWIGHGVDLEEIADFPEWPPRDADARVFFETHFTASERAGAEAHAEPRAHLCGLWCAKEALRKALPAAAGAGWGDIEILSGADGAPCIRRPVTPGVALTLSISHSSRQAMASVIAWREGR